MTFLLRVALPDRPGSLGAVATALGEVGADIISLDVVERGPEGAIDDLVVALPTGRLADSLLTACHAVPGVAVESLRPYAGSRDLHGDLELVEALAAEPARATEVLIEHLPAVFRAGWALLLGMPETSAASAGAPPPPDELPWLPLAAAIRLDPADSWVPESWRLLGTELAATPFADGGVVLLGRPGGPSFRDSEIARLAHLAGIARTVGTSPTSPVTPG